MTTPLEFVIERRDLTVGEVAEALVAFAQLVVAIEEADGPRDHLVRVRSVSHRSPYTFGYTVEPSVGHMDRSAAIVAATVHASAELGAGRVRSVPAGAAEAWRRIIAGPASSAAVRVEAPTLNQTAEVPPGIHPELHRALSTTESIGALRGTLETVSVHNVERRTASSQRDDVINGQVGG